MMSNPKRVLIYMLLFMVIVALVGALLAQPLVAAFEANSIFNGTILGVLLVGIIINLRQVLILSPEVRWVNHQITGVAEDKVAPPKRLLMPLAKMLDGRNQDGFRMSAITMRSVMDGIRVRLDESRDLSHYMTGLLIFLGLLGTFWGLLDTVAGVADVISGFAHADQAKDENFFVKLTADLQEPLGGMGTAFSSSLFGMIGALIVGFMDLQAGHAQNRFVNDLEEWLADVTHLPSNAITGHESENSLPGYVEALLEQTADNLDKLQRAVSRNEKERHEDFNKQIELTEKIAELTDQMRTEQKLVMNLNQNQMDLQPAIMRLADAVSSGVGSGGNPDMSEHLRNIDVYMEKMLQINTENQTRFREELREELKVLATTLLRKV